jgi:hypothetical protein
VFLFDAERPPLDDRHWTTAPDGDFIGFSETSTIPDHGYVTAQFRYFRTAIYVPDGGRPSSLTVTATDIDDAVFLALFSPSRPDGFSPLDAGPSDPDVGACYGNGGASWDIARFLDEGEVNHLLVVHADMNPFISSLSTVEIMADGRPIQMVSCADQD